MSIAIDKSLQVKITNRQILKIALPISVALIIPNINFIANNIFLGGLVVRIVSLGMIMMSIAVIWLNDVTGTGKTKMNLLIELIAVICYLIYIYLVMVRFRLSLTIAWTNEFVYWTVIFAIAFWYIKSGRWKSSEP